MIEKYKLGWFLSDKFIKKEKNGKILILKNMET